MLGALIYTSSRNGLFPGNTGFSTVACNREMDLATRQKLEQLSGYLPLYPHYDSRSAQNPENFSHRVVGIAGRRIHVLSRICFNGMDYTQRSNKLASHLAMTEEELERFPGGPGEVLQDTGIFKDATWPIHPEYLPYPQPREGAGAPDGCRTWRRLVGDAGWAGAILERFLNFPQKTFYFVFAPEQHRLNLELMRELLKLAPPALRWQVTFSTYFTENVTGCECRLRFCPPDSPLLAAARKRPEANEILDLRQPAGPAQGGQYVECARAGKIPLKTPPAQALPPSPAGMGNPPPPPFPRGAMPSMPPAYVPPARVGMGAEVAGTKTAPLMVVLLLLLGVFVLYWHERGTRSQVEEAGHALEEQAQELWLQMEDLLEMVKGGVPWKKLPPRLVATWEQKAGEYKEWAEEKASTPGEKKRKPGKAVETESPADPTEEQRRTVAEKAQDILDEIKEAWAPGNADEAGIAWVGLVEELGKEGEAAYVLSDGVKRGLEYVIALEVDGEPQKDKTFTFSKQERQDNAENQSQPGAQENQAREEEKVKVKVEMEGRFLFLTLSPNSDAARKAVHGSDLLQKKLKVTLKAKEGNKVVVDFGRPPLNPDELPGGQWKGSYENGKIVLHIPWEKNGKGKALREVGACWQLWQNVENQGNEPTNGKMAASMEGGRRRLASMRVNESADGKIEARLAPPVEWKSHSKKRRQEIESEIQQWETFRKEGFPRWVHNGRDRRHDTDSPNQDKQVEEAWKNVPLSSYPGEEQGTLPQGLHFHHNETGHQVVERLEKELAVLNQKEEDKWRTLEREWRDRNMCLCLVLGGEERVTISFAGFAGDESPLGENDRGSSGDKGEGETSEGGE